MVEAWISRVSRVEVHSMYISIAELPRANGSMAPGAPAGSSMRPTRKSGLTLSMKSGFSRVREKPKVRGSLPS